MAALTARTKTRIANNKKDLFLDMSQKGNNQKPGFTGPHRFEMDSWISCAPFEQLLNIEILEASDGQAILTMPFFVDLAQGAGLMHGGALVSLADTAVVMAIKSLVTSGTHFATISCETRFLYPVKKGNVTAKARIAEMDGRLVKGQAVVYNDKNLPVMEFSAVFKIAKDCPIKTI